MVGEKSQLLAEVSFFLPESGAGESVQIFRIKRRRGVKPDDLVGLPVDLDEFYLNVSST